MLTEQEIEEFQKITLEVYGKTITREEAISQGERLIRVMELMATTLSPKDLVHKKNSFDIKKPSCL